MGDGVNPFEIIKTDDNLDGTIKNGNTGGRRRKGRLAGGVRDSLTMGEMKARMAALWKNGDTMVEIAQQVSDEFNLPEDQRLSAHGISYHIKALKKYWRDVGLLHIDERMSMVLARYDQLEMIAMEAYFMSCEGRSTDHYEKSSDRARSKEREKLLLEQIQEERERRRMELPVNSRRSVSAELHLDNGELEEALITTHEKIKEYRRTDSNAAGDPKWVTILVDINDKRAALWGMKNRRGPTNEDQERAKLTDEQRQERLAAVISSAMHRKEQGNTNLAPMSPLGGWEEGDVVPETTVPDQSIEDFVEETRVIEEQEAIDLWENHPEEITELPEEDLEGFAFDFLEDEDV